MVFQEFGVIRVGGGSADTPSNDSVDKSENAEDRSVSPCRFTFIGDNVVHGKSALSSKPRTKKVKKFNYKAGKDQFQDYSRVAFVPYPHSNAYSLHKTLIVFA